MKKISKGIFFLSIFLSPFIANAQSEQTDPGYAERPINGDQADVPVDGGLSLLLVAGVSYGAKKMYDKQKKGGVIIEN